MNPARSIGPVAPPKSGLRVIAGERDGSPYPKASLWLRGGARLTDLVLAWALYRACGPAGFLVALLFVLFGDGFFAGQSLGKKLFGVRAVHLPTRAPVRFRDSVLRNAPLGLVVLLGMMPEGLGPIAFAAGALAIGGIEAVKAYRDPLGLRLGDVWAQTQVVDGKVVAGAAIPAGAAANGAGRVTITRRARETCASR